MSRNTIACSVFYTGLTLSFTLAFHQQLPLLIVGIAMCIGACFWQGAIKDKERRASWK